MINCLTIRGSRRAAARRGLRRELCGPRSAAEEQLARGPITRLHAGLVACILSSCVSIGCSEVATYGENRVRDLSDIVDVRYGAGFGLGLSVQVGEPLRTGLGCSEEWYQRQWFGRKSVESRDGLFASALIIGFDGDYLRREEASEWFAKSGATSEDLHRLEAEPWFSESGSTTGNFNEFFFTQRRGSDTAQVGTKAWFTEPAGNLPSLGIARIGGAVFLPVVNGGLYLNLGEALDFLFGLASYDLMNDDGYPKFFTPDPDARGT